MNFTGKLYGKIGNKYFDTGKTTDDYDAMVMPNPKDKPEMWCINCGETDNFIFDCNRALFTHYKCGHCGESVTKRSGEV